jgi:hypothetical protein
MAQMEREKAMPPLALREFRATLEAIPDAVRSDEPRIDAALAPVFAHLNALDHALSAASIPALFHGYATGGVGHRSVWLTSYFVEQRSELQVGEVTQRFARGRRLDTLNLEEAAVVKASREDWAIVSLDRTDEQLVQLLLTPLNLGALVDVPASGAEEASIATEEILRDASRFPSVLEEVKALSKLRTEDAETLRSAILRRNEALVSLAKMGAGTEASSRIRLEPATVRGLEHLKGSRFAKSLADEVLGVERRMKVYAKPFQPIVAELANIQEARFMGRLYEQRAGSFEAPSDSALEKPAAEALRDATLAALARPQPCPRLFLWLTLHTAFDRRAAEQERQGARYAIRALYTELGLSDDLEHLARHRDGFGRPVAEIQAAAQRAYASFSGGRPPPSLTRRNL